MKKMKTGIILIAAITLSAIMTACGGNNKEKHDGMMESTSEKSMTNMKEDDNKDNMQSDMSPMMASYMDIKNALVSDNAEKAGKTASEMMDMVEMDDMKNSLKTISSSDDLKQQRMAFSDLSKQMYNMAKMGKMKEMMYWNHCPMAMDGKGANWLSMNEKISNPYMGQKMPGCGSVQEKLNNEN